MNTHKWTTNCTKVLFSVLIGFSFLGTSEAQTLYAITSNGRLDTVDTTSGSTAVVRSGIGTTFQAITYIAPYFYGIYDSGKLKRFTVSGAGDQYIGDTGYPYIKSIAKASNGYVYVSYATTSTGYADHTAQLSLSNASVSNAVSYSSPFAPPSYINLIALGYKSGGVLRGISWDTAGSAELFYADPTSGGTINSPTYYTSYGYFLGNHQIISIAVNPSDDSILGIQEPLSTTSNTYLYQIIDQNLGISSPNYVYEFDLAPAYRSITYMPATVDTSSDENYYRIGTTTVSF